MSAYLKYLQIEEVEETAEHPSAYLKIVNIVEVVDQDGNPWEPEPGPDPWDDLVVNEKALLHESNIYEIGETIYATTATYIGGSEDVIYRWRWQTRATSSDDWVNGSWTSYDNELTQTDYTLTDGGQVRFQCQAKDNDPEHAGQVNSFTAAQTVPYPALQVSTPTATGQPNVGETLTCSEPTVTGGLAPYTLGYHWVDDSNAMIWESQYMGQTITVTEDMLGKNMKCLVTATSTDNQNETVASNAIGPIEAAIPPPTFGDITVTVNDIEYDYEVAAPLTILMNDPIPATVSITGDATPTYAWSARNDYPLMVGSQTASTVLTFPQEGSVSVTCTLTDPNTEEKNTSVVISFYVVDAFE